MQLDIRTILIMFVLSTLLLWGMLHLSLKRQQRDPDMRAWLSIFPIQALGWMLLSLRGVLPDWITVVVANGLLFTAITLIYAAIRTFLRQPLPRGGLLLIISLFFVSFSTLHQAGAGIGERIIFVCATTGTMEALSGFALLRGLQRQDAPARWATGCWYLACSAAMFGRGAWTVFHPESGQQLLSGSAPHAVAFLIAYAALLGTSLGYSLMVKERRDAEIERLVRMDDLTDTVNRRGLFEHLRREVARTRRKGGPGLGLLMVDVDHFKAINDTHGHASGDQVLRELCFRLKGCLREHDVLGRYGGEEFGVVLTDTSQSETLLMAERLRATLEAQAISVGTRTLPVTISIGCTHLPPYIHRNEDSLFDEADQALYQAKAAGRNRVMLMDSAHATPHAAPSEGDAAA